MRLLNEMQITNRHEAFVFWYGAIAQLGERVLCKHEVVGSIPSGSTRWLSKIDECSFIPSAKHHFACHVLRDVRAGFLTSYRGD